MYIDTLDREFDTLEELWKLINEMDRYSFHGRQIQDNNKPIESPGTVFQYQVSAQSLHSEIKFAKNRIKQTCNCITGCCYLKLLMRH